MSAAKLLRSRGLRYSTLAIVGCSGLASLARSRPAVSLDSPPSASWPQDASLVGHGRREHRNYVATRSGAQYTKRGDAELVHKANDADVYQPTFEDDDDNAWATFSRNFSNIKDGFTGIEWSGIGGQISDYILPPWAKYIPEGFQKLQFELSMEPGSLADEIWQEAHDADINPEILWDARVRVSSDLCNDELNFLRKRKKRVVQGLAKFLDLDENDINPADVPTIAMCGSGGGLRALVAGTSSYTCAQEAGLFDCVTYTAGVSGSCWLQSLYYSSLGKQDHKTLLEHIKSRIGVHIAFPPAALKLATSAPTNKFILSGFIEKLKGDPGAEFGLVDVYSLLLAARLMVPKGDLDVQDQDLKLSNQRQYIENGEHPLPIYTVVRHEIPVIEKLKEEDKHDLATQQKAKEQARKEAWFQWIEMHPWEVFCEEFGAGIPTWSLGRPFSGGRSQLMEAGVALPEMRQSLLLGIFGSAFCATLSHYYKEIKPLVSGITGFGGLDGLMEDKNEDLIRLHPIEPATIPNFVYGMKGQLPDSCPESVFKADHLQLMDAGMSNNLPIYPLLRPGRDVDILIAFDASADIQKENWLSVVDGYAKQRGIKGWPVGTGWPRTSTKALEDAQIFEEAQATSAQEAASKIAEIREERRQENQTSEEEDGKPTESPTTGIDRPNADTELGYCNVWVGTKEERTSEKDAPPSKRLSWDSEEESAFQLMEPNAGIAVVYFPLLPNDKIPGVDPDKTDYLSTWNFIYTPEQIDQVVALAKANFEEGQDATKRTVRAVYERKKRLRIEKEKKSEVKWWRRKLREEGDTFSGIDHV